MAAAPLAESNGRYRCLRRLFVDPNATPAILANVLTALQGVWSACPENIPRFSPRNPVARVLQNDTPNLVGRTPRSVFGFSPELIGCASSGPKSFLTLRHFSSLRSQYLCLYFTGTKYSHAPLIGTLIPTTSLEDRDYHSGLPVYLPVRPA